MHALDALLAREQFGIKLGLDAMRTLCAALGHPERRCTVVHVAGTNGKGSVTAMTARGLAAAGLRTGRYTSPHLIELDTGHARAVRCEADEVARPAAWLQHAHPFPRDSELLGGVPHGLHDRSRRVVGIERRSPGLRPARLSAQ